MSNIPPKISIIVPIYNSRLYIEKLLKSILNQSYTNWEVIFIEDCGKDNTYEYLLRKSKNDSRISVYKNEINLGVDKTRFKGIDLAKGEYIIFIDGDDWLGDNALEIMYNAAVKYNVDYVCGAYSSVIDRFGFVKRKPSNMFGPIIAEKYICQPELFEKYYSSYFGVSGLLHFMWGKLYKTNVLRNAGLKPSGFKIFEDTIFNMHLHPHLTSILIIEEVVYYYRWGGITNNFYEKALSDAKIQYRIKAELLAKYNYQKGYKTNYLDLVNKFYNHFFNYALYRNIDESHLTIMIEDELKDDIYVSEFNINDVRVKNIVEKNIALIVSDIIAKAKNERPKMYVKRFVSNLLR